MKSTNPDPLKRAAALRALDFVSNGMKLGLGSGSTSEAFLDLLGARVRQGLRIVGVPTSEGIATKARALGITLAELDAIAPLDLCVDGADEVDGGLNLIKGGGGALLREKIVAVSSKRMLVIVDGRKRVDCLGRFPLPVEVVEFGHGTTAARIRDRAARLGYKDLPIALRRNQDVTFKTDGGNVIYDCGFGAIRDVPELSAALSSLAGVVDHGLYVGIASAVIVARPEGVEVIERAG